MTTKFDINNLPDMKIRVNTPEESERAQRAFFALGGDWRDSQWMIDKFIDGLHWFLLSKGDKYLHLIVPPNTPPIRLFEEITLAELEALAAEKQAVKLDIGKVGEILPFYPTPESEAQERYNAAMEVLKEVNKSYGVPLLSFHEKALKIAAGLNQPKQ